MKRKLLISCVCSLLGSQAFSTDIAPIMWPVSYTVETPFIYPLEEIGVKFDHPIKLMDDTCDPITVKYNGVVVAEATTLEIINYDVNRYVEGVLNVHFNKQNLPKGKSYEICIPEGIVGWNDITDGTQIVNAAASTEFSVPSSLGPTQGTQDGEYIRDSKHSIVVFWDYETKAVGEAKFELYRENEKVAELPASVVGWDWNLGQASPEFDEYMTFDKDINYKLVLPAGCVSSVYRDDITNDEVVINFIGAYTDPSLPFSYSWCSLFTDHSHILGEVSFTFDRPIEITPEAKIQLFEIYPSEQLIMEVTPWINTDSNCWNLMCDFGGYHRNEEWGFTIVIPEGAVISADGQNIKCARSEFRNDSAGLDDASINEEFPMTYYNLQGFKVVNPKKGNIYILNGKKMIFK